MMTHNDIEARPEYKRLVRNLRAAGYALVELSSVAGRDLILYVGGEGVNLLDTAVTDELGSVPG